MSLIKVMPKLFDQKGLVHLTTLVPVIVLILGLAAALYLISNPTVFRPKADYKTDPSESISIKDSTGKVVKCKDNTCEVDTANVELTIDVNGLNAQ